MTFTPGIERRQLFSWIFYLSVITTDAKLQWGIAAAQLLGATQPKEQKETWTVRSGRISALETLRFAKLQDKRPIHCGTSPGVDIKTSRIHSVDSWCLITDHGQPRILIRLAVFSTQLLPGCTGGFLKWFIVLGWWAEAYSHRAESLGAEALDPYLLGSGSCFLDSKRLRLRRNRKSQVNPASLFWMFSIYGWHWYYWTDTVPCLRTKDNSVKFRIFLAKKPNAPPTGRFCFEDWTWWLQVNSERNWTE